VPKLATMKSAGRWLRTRSSSTSARWSRKRSECSKVVVEDEEIVEKDVRKEEVDVEDRTERLGGQAEEGRRAEGPTDGTTPESERRAVIRGEKEQGKKKG
jgi:hypothetical protein